MNIQNQCEGFFRLVARDAAGNITRDSGEFRNLITNWGLDRFATTGGSAVSGVVVGTGSTPPAASDTVAATFRAASTSGSGLVSEVKTTPELYSQQSITYRFAAGAASGNLTEVGATGETSTPWRLTSRTLITDDSGQPTTFTVLPTEVLDVTYTLRTYHMAADSVITGVDMFGTPRTVSLRPAVAADTYNGMYSTSIPAALAQSSLQPYDGVMGPATGSPTGSASSSSANAVVTPYVPGSFKMQASWFFGTGVANLPKGIRSIQVNMGSGHPKWQMQIDPPLMKTNAHTCTFVLEFSWGRKS